MGGTGFKNNYIRMSSETWFKLHNALQDIPCTYECLLNCWKTACKIACKKYCIEIVYDSNEAINEAEYWTCILVKMCFDKEADSE